MWAMYRRDGMSEDLTQSASTHNLEPDYEEARWKAVSTAECGFFSANRLKRLFSAPPFVGALRAEDRSPGRLVSQGVPELMAPTRSETL
jgi:hypothetical protein